MKNLKGFLRTLSQLFLAFALAVAVWVMAVTANDPIQERNLPSPVALKIIGQGTSLVVTSSIPESVTVKVSAPSSVWTAIQSQAEPATAYIDLSTLEAGIHEVPVQVQISEKPTRIISIDPVNVSVTLEERDSKMVPVNVNVIGEPSFGFKVESATTDYQTVEVSGPQTLMGTVQSVRASVDITNARENYTSSVALQALDLDGNVVSGLTITPSDVMVNLTVSALGGYRNVVVKVVWTGQLALGYRLTDISVDPPAVTVYSTEPSLVENLTGVVETTPLDLNGASTDFTTQLSLLLPAGVSTIDQNQVVVHVSISAIESSLTFSNIPVEVIGLGRGLQAQISPQLVDIILNGPLPVLDQLTSADIHVVVDLTGLEAGTYKKEPIVTISVQNVQKSAVVPGTLDVTITSGTNP